MHFSPALLFLTFNPDQTNSLSADTLQLVPTFLQATHYSLSSGLKYWLEFVVVVFLSKCTILYRGSLFLFFFFFFSVSGPFKGFKKLWNVIRIISHKNGILKLLYNRSDVWVSDVLVTYNHTSQLLKQFLLNASLFFVVVEGPWNCFCYRIWLSFVHLPQDFFQQYLLITQQCLAHKCTVQRSFPIEINNIILFDKFWFWGLTKCHKYI